jgi:uncharacterized phage protein gp47/JayE
MTDQLPAEFQLPTREELARRHRQLQKIRNPAIDVSEGTEPHNRSLVAADDKLSLIAGARRISNNAVVSDATGSAVARWGEIEGVEPGEATGSAGVVKIVASVGGGTILQGDILKIKNNQGGPRFQCSITAQYKDGALVPINAIDTGRETNVSPGTVMVWEESRPGIGPEATVQDQGEGVGLAGGRDTPTVEEHQAAIIEKKQNPPAAGNDADWQKAARDTPGVPVQQAFTYPAIKGPGTISLVFTVSPERIGGSRAPSSEQINLVRSNLLNRFGADDGALIGSIVEDPTTVVYGVTWSAAPGWLDAAPWPAYAPTASGAVVVSAVTDALNFTLRTDDDQYSGVTAPAAGKTIAFYNPTTTKFSFKRIQSVTGTGPWAIVVDASNLASDESYAPVVGQRVSPYSQSLDAVASNVVELFSSLGPGEQTSLLPDDGIRKRRSPKAPASWPYTLTQRDAENAVSTAQVFDRELLEGDGATPAVGTPGVVSHMLSLGDLAFFPKT